MKNKTYRNFYIFSLIGLLLISFYPLYLGIKMTIEMISTGHTETHYRYIIPLFPMCIAVIVCVAIMPLLIRSEKKIAIPIACFIALGLFLLCEFIFENYSYIVINYGYGDALDAAMNGMSAKADISLSSMFNLCCTEREDEIIEVSLINEIVSWTNESFKFHFYGISMILIFCAVTCFYNFGYMIKCRNYTKLRYDITQAVAVFICLCAGVLKINLEYHDVLTLMHEILAGVIVLSVCVATSVAISAFFRNRNGWFSVVLPLIISTITSWYIYIVFAIISDKLVSGSIFEEIILHRTTPTDIYNMLVMICISSLVLLLLQFERQKEILTDSDEEVEIYYFE